MGCVGSSVASTDTIGARYAGSRGMYRGGETDLAVASGSPDADVVVLVTQMDVVGSCGCCQACRGARVPVKTRYPSCNINLETSTSKRV